jgi:hypothetical protein
MSEVIGKESVWTGAPCTHEPKKVIKSHIARVKDMCIECPVLDKCEDLVNELKPTQAQWAGLTRTVKSYYPDGSPATVLGVANKPSGE